MLRPLAFHRATGFELDSSSPGLADPAMTIVAIDLGRIQLRTSGHQFWHCLELSGDRHARILALVDGETGLICGNDGHVCEGVARARYSDAREPLSTS